MFFYHYRIKESDSISHAVAGNFSGFKRPEVIVCRGRNLEILCIYKPVGEKSERLQRLMTVDLNSRILSLEKIPGLEKDNVAIVSDCGKLMILEFDVKRLHFKMVKEHILEKKKLEVTPRFTPGQYLAVDPQSKAVAVGAIERKLLFYALEAPDEYVYLKSKPRFIYYDLVSIFNDKEISMFACLEVQSLELKYPNQHDGRQLPDSMKETNLPSNCSEKNLPKPTSSLITDFNTPVFSLKRRLDASSFSDDDFRSTSKEQMQSQNVIPLGKDNFKTSSFSSDFTKFNPLVNASNSAGYNPQSSHLLNELDLTVDAAHSDEDNLQTINLSSHLNDDYDTRKKIAIDIVKKQMQIINDQNGCNQQNLPMEVSPAKNIVKPSNSERFLPHLKCDVHLPTFSTSNLKEKQSIFLKECKSDSSDEIIPDDESICDLLSLTYKETQEKGGMKLLPMVLRIYKWHWQSKTMFEHAIPLSNHANKLISVPPGDCHKGGILLCFCNKVVFLEVETNKQICSYFPQQMNLAFENKKGMLISGSATYKRDDKLIILLQSEIGDLYSVEIVRENEQLNIKWTFIDSVPVASAMCIIEEKMLFLAADYEDHLLYKIKSLGSMENEISHKIHKITDSEKLDLYIERDLTHLELFSRIENLMPVISCIAEDHVCIKKYIPDDSEEHNPTTNRSSFHVCNKLLQLHFACGQGSCSSLRTMRYGVEVIELKSKKLPENHPNCIWTYNEERNEGTVSFIIISFSIDSKAIVLSFNGEIIAVPSAELQRIHPKFEKDHLLDYVHISNDSSIQVFSHGVRYKFGDNKVEWILPTCKCPSEGSRKKSTTEQLKCERHIIYQCAINKNQIALALKTKELVYLEVIESKEEIFTFEEKRSGNILDYALRYIKFLSNGDTAEYLMLCFENTIEIFSVEDEGISKESFAKLDLLYKPSSLTVHTAGNGDQLISYLTVGFEGGYIQRFIFIHENGELMNSFLLKLEDSKTVTLIKMKIYEEEAIIALTTCCTWICFNCTTQFEFVPLLYEKIDYAVGFSCVSYPMANLIAVLGQRLVFLHVKKSCTLVLENCQQLKLTPRQFTMIEEEEQNLLIISLSDYGKSDHKDGNDSPQYTMDSALGRMYSKDPSPSENCPSEIVKNKPFSRYDCELCIYGTVEKKFFCSFKLPRDHSIVRMCKVEFNSRPDEWYIVAVVKKSSYKHKTVKCKPLPIVESELFFESYLILYSLNEDTYSLKEVCTMKTDYVAEAMCPFAGRLLVGINDTLCLCNFETGLFMETNQKMPCKISDIYAYEDMFVVLCDNRNVIYGYYTETHEEFIIPDLKILCEDQNLHKVTDICFWDQDIMVAADLYGYLNIVLTPAIPDDVTKKDCKLPTRFKRNEEDKLGRDKEPNTEEYRFMPKSYVLTRHYIGETVTCLQLTSFLMESRSLFLYCTLSGTVGVLEPFFDEKPDSIFKPLQFLIKSKCQFHNRDSTDYPSNYVDKEKLNEDQYHVPNQRTSMPLWAALTSEDGNVDSSDTSDEVYTDETSESFSMTGQSSRAKLLTTISSREPPLFVIDGNLCDLFHTLSEEEQQDIADQLDKKPYEISEKLAELKATMHFGVNNDWQKDSQF